MANVFAELWLLFRGDTSGLKKSTDEANNATQNLEKNVNKVNKEFEKVGHHFGRMVTQLAEAALAFASIHSVITGLADAVNYDVELGKTSRALGVNSEDLDVWGNAVKQAGGTAEGFQNSLKGLAEHFHTTAKVALQALPQLADVFSHISRYSAFSYGKSLGLDESTILLLQQGRREVEAYLKRQKELGVVTQKDIEVTTKFNQELGNVGHAFRTLYNALVIPLLPALTEFFQKLEDGLLYLTDHKDLVVGAFVGIAAAAFSAAIAFGLITLEGILLSAGLILLIGLFALLWEDTKVYFNGGKSLIGEYIDEWKRLGTLIDSIIDRWTDKFLNFLDKFSLLKPIADYIRNNDNSFTTFQKSKEGKNLLAFASATPLNSQTSNSVLNSSAFSRNFTINSMPIEIVTQATDAAGISAHIGLTLPDHLNQANNFFANNNYA